MKTLDSLIRLNRWQLDEKRRALVELETLIGSLHDERRRVEEALARERQILTDDPDPTIGFGAFLDAIKGRRAAIDQSIAQAQAKLDALREDIADAFQDLKTVETAEEDRVRRAALVRKRRDGAALDEIALTRYLRHRGGRGGVPDR